MIARAFRHTLRDRKPTLGYAIKQAASNDDRAHSVLCNCIECDTPTWLRRA